MRRGPAAMWQRWARTAARRLAATDRGAALLTRVRDGAERALDDVRYDTDYYRADPSGDGYGAYDRRTSNADRLATIVWTWFRPGVALDVGCAAGFLVEALVELGIDGRGVDLSDAAFDLATPAIRPRLRRVDLRDGLDARDRSVDLITAFETLEHLRPADVPGAVAELARVSSGWVVASMPSVGTNESGPDGWFEGKVHPDRVAHYTTDPSAVRGPIPFGDLAVDADGLPIKGHLTIAPYSWWTAQFAAAGMTRALDLERRMHVDLARYGLSEFVCLYVFRHADVVEPQEPVRTPDEIAEIEERLGLTDHDEPVHHHVAAYDWLRVVGLELRPGLDPPPGR